MKNERTVLHNVEDYISFVKMHQHSIDEIWLPPRAFQQLQVELGLEAGGDKQSLYYKGFKIMNKNDL